MTGEYVPTLPIQAYAGTERYRTGEVPRIYDRVRSLGREWTVVSFSDSMESVWFSAGTGNLIRHCDLIERGHGER